MYMSPRMDVRILCHRLCSARADTEAYVIDSGILTILGWLVVSPSNKIVSSRSPLMNACEMSTEQRWRSFMTDKVIIVRMAAYLDVGANTSV